MAFIQFNQTIVGEIPGAQTNVGGFLQEGTPTPLSIEGSIQPASSRDLETLPEGRRINKTYAVYTQDEMQENWRLTIYGQSYTCVDPGVWQNGVLPHYKALMQKTEAVGES
jgi:hypothetical protein